MKKTLALLALASTFPLSALAQQAGETGKVYLSEGQVSARRVTAPSPIALKVQDSVFVRDVITTGAESLVKMVLGGKATVTVREHSSLTITEEPGRNVINMAANPPNGGKVAVTLTKARMKPGEEIQIRTPNAIASVRGSFAVVEFEKPSATAPDTTHIDNVTGTDVRGAIAPPAGVAPTFIVIPTGQGFTIINNILGSLRPTRPTVMQKLIAKGKPGQGQKPANPNLGSDVSALGGTGIDSNMPGAGLPRPFQPGYSRGEAGPPRPFLPGYSRGGYISKP